MCPPATSMFMTNIMLLWWKLDSVPLPLVSRKRLCSGDPSRERKCKVTSIKPKWQIELNLQCSYITLLERLFRSKRNWLRENRWHVMNRLHFSLSVNTSADMFLDKVLSGGTLLSALWQNIRREPDFTRGQPMHPPRVPQRPNFRDIFNAWAWNANCSLWIRNAMYKVFSTTTSQM